MISDGEQGVQGTHSQISRLLLHPSFISGDPWIIMDLLDLTVKELVILSHVGRRPQDHTQRCGGVEMS